MGAGMGPGMGGGMMMSDGTGSEWSGVGGPGDARNANAQIAGLMEELEYLKGTAENLSGQLDIYQVNEEREGKEERGMKEGRGIRK